MQENADVEEQELNKTANNVNNFQEAILLFHRYEDIIKTQNKKAIKSTFIPFLSFHKNKK